MPNGMFQLDLIGQVFLSAATLSVCCFFNPEVIFHWNSHPLLSLSVSLCFNVVLKQTPHLHFAHIFCMAQYFFLNTVSFPGCYAPQTPVVPDFDAACSAVPCWAVSCWLTPRINPCTLRSSVICQRYPWFIEVATSLHRMLEYPPFLSRITAFRGHSNVCLRQCYHRSFLLPRPWRIDAQR